MIRVSFNDGWQARPKVNPFAEMGGVSVPFRPVTVPWPIRTAPSTPQPTAR